MATNRPAARASTWATPSHLSSHLRPSNLNTMAAKAAKKAKKVAAKKPTSGKKKNKKRNTSTFNTYIFRVLKQVHPKVGLSKKSMSIMNSFVTDTFDKVATEAGKLCKNNKKKTLSSREVQTALRLVLPGELAKHAVSEGTKAVTKFSSA